MADTFAQFSAKLDQTKRLLDGQALRQVTTRVATKAKANAIRGIEPNTLSHWGKKAYTVKARFDLVSDHEAKLYPTVSPLAALLEKGSGTTWKSPRRRNASGKRGKAKRQPYHRAKVPARKSWTKAVALFGPKVPGDVQEEVQRVLREVFGG